MTECEAIDVPLMRLHPLRDRTVPGREYERILASIKAIGLIEPLVIYPDGVGYAIVDGVQRYKAMLELGVKIAPCILGPQREAFTGNRMVNRVSPVQENRMIQKSLGELDEQTIANTLGIAALTYRLKKTLLKQLHPDVVAAFDQGTITRTCAREFTHVTPARQKQILAAMVGYKDFGIPFARALILKTPISLRERRPRRKSPWDKTATRKGELLKKLTEAEQKHEFYSRLYKQYTIDLLRLAIFARSLLTNTRVRAYLDEHHPALAQQFETVIADVRG